MTMSFKQHGSTDKIEKFLKAMGSMNYKRILDPYGREGVAALAANTPAYTGLAANSWDYKIVETATSVRIVWTNSNVENGFPVVIALQYGYATGTGGYVQGRDFINPAIKPIFDKIADAVWKEVKSA